MPSQKIIYNKQALSPPDLIAHLLSKNLHIPSQADATKAICSIGYYRLLIYMRALQDPTTKKFHNGTEFKDILNLYNFDRVLRLHCLDAIEKIEVALRAAIINHLSVQHGPHFYMDIQHYSNQQGHTEFLATIQKCKYLAIDHYHSTYMSPSLPPIWAVAEATTFGTLSRLYSNLTSQNQKSIASEFQYDKKVLKSWLRAIASFRNICAHHNRLWNARIPIDKPLAANNIASEFTMHKTSFSDRAVVANALLKTIDSQNTWGDELKKIIHNYNIPSGRLGFKSGWDKSAFWN